MCSGRPGPVVVGLPEDMLTAAASARACAATITTAAAPPADVVQDLAAQLARARQPLMMVGGSDWTDAGREAVEALAERHSIPLMATFRCNDLIDNHHRCYAGEAGVAITPAARALIDSVGWREAYVALGVIVWLLVIPATALFAPKELPPSTRRGRISSRAAFSPSRESEAFNSPAAPTRKPW